MLVGLEIPGHSERAELFAKDPVAAAQYYNIVLNAFCDHLLAYNQENGGLFGHVSAYYGITEEQLSGTLHNHLLVWLHNNISPSELREQIQNEEFKERLIKYLEKIIKQSYPVTNNVNDDLDVSEVSCKHPINPDDHPIDSVSYTHLTLPTIYSV